jgi:hypothetical protein
MISFLIALSGDIFAIIIIVRAIKLIRRPQHNMTETNSDYQGRKFFGYFICLVAAAAVIANHVFF